MQRKGELRCLLLDGTLMTQIKLIHTDVIFDGTLMTQRWHADDAD